MPLFMGHAVVSATLPAVWETLRKRRRRWAWLGFTNSVEGILVQERERYFG